MVTDGNEAIPDEQKESRGGTFTAWRPEFLNRVTNKWEAIRVGRSPSGIPYPLAMAELMSMTETYGEHQAKALANAFAAEIDASGPDSQLWKMAPPEVRIVQYIGTYDVKVSRALT